jgi:PST family polysaccharide transporter
MLFPIQNITSVVSRVLFPALSKLKEDNDKSKEIYLNVAKSVAFISFPIMIGFFVINENFVSLFFAEKWNPIINLLYILVPVGLIQSVYTLAGAIYQSRNRTRLWLYWGIISSFITVSGFYVGLNWGIIGVAISYLITNLILIIPGSKIPFNLIELRVVEYLKTILPTFFISVLMGLAVYFVRYLMVGIFNEIFVLVTLIVFGVAFYVVFSFQFNRTVMMKIFQRIKSS